MTALVSESSLEASVLVFTAIQLGAEVAWSPFGRGQIESQGNWGDRIHLTGGQWPTCLCSQTADTRPTLTLNVVLVETWHSCHVSRKFPGSISRAGSLCQWLQPAGRVNGLMSHSNPMTETQMQPTPNLPRRSIFTLDLASSLSLHLLLLVVGGQLD